MPNKIYLIRVNATDVAVAIIPTINDIYCWGKTLIDQSINVKIYISTC